MWYFMILFSILFITARAFGDFAILHSPSSLEFKGNEPLQSENVADVILASLGHPIQEGTNWHGLIIGNIFTAPSKALTFIVEGTDHIHLKNKEKTYPLVGNDADKSLDTLAIALENYDSQIVDLNLKEGINGVDTYSDIFGNMKLPPIPKLSESNLKPNLHTGDQKFLEQIVILNELAKELPKLKNQPDVLTIRLSIELISEAYGEKSSTFAEALKTLSDSIRNFASAFQKTFGEKILITVVTTKLDNHSRLKRQATPTNDIDPSKLNLATDYSEDYPVIFNIILWFGVVMAFSLLSIAYVIATMDPGRDSIIYRMTSTRMKKDN